MSFWSTFTKTAIGTAGVATALYGSKQLAKYNSEQIIQTGKSTKERYNPESSIEDIIGAGLEEAIYQEQKSNNNYAANLAITGVGTAMTIVGVSNFVDIESYLSGQTSHEE